MRMDHRKEVKKMNDDDRQEDLSRDAKLTALALMREAMYEPAVTITAQAGVLNLYMGRHDSGPKEIGDSLLWLATWLARAAMVNLMMRLRDELGRLPTEAEVIAQLDHDELGVISEDGTR
jgi:hypothetical protein